MEAVGDLRVGGCNHHVIGYKHRKSSRLFVPLRCATIIMVIICLLDGIIIINCDKQMTALIDDIDTSISRLPYNT